MFEFIKNIFGRKKEEKKEPAMEHVKPEPLPLNPETEEIHAPETRYTEEYAQFNEKLTASPERTLEEEMLDDPFADVAAQDEDVEVPEAPLKEEEESEEETFPENMDDPFADIAAQYDDDIE